MKKILSGLLLVGFGMASVMSLAMSLAPSSAQAADVVDVKTRDGVSVRMSIMIPKKPVASVVLFAGGAGNLKIKKNGGFGWGKGNFLVRTRLKFKKAGFVTAVIDAPSDKGNTGLQGFRSSPEHTADIKAVIAHMRSTYKVPVWLVGTSRGTTSVANGGANIGDGGADGIVLTSSMSMKNDKGGHVLDFDLSKVTAPTLITHHKNDGCWVTPYAGATKIKAALTQAKAVELLTYTGGKERSKPCQAKSYHGYMGLEKKVVADIAKWIKAH